MLKPEERLAFEVQQADGTWVPAHLEDLEGNDLVRMKKADGSFVTGPEGQTNFRMQDTPMFQGDWID
jgi:hypothetical protein